MWKRLTLCALLVGACGKNKASSPEAEGEAPAEAAAASATDSPPQAKESQRVVRVAPTPEERTAYRKALRAGRKLQKEKKYAEAIVSFEKALLAIPKDARANSEISYAALMGGDIARSKTAAEASVRYASDPRVRAASLYNLARALEEEGGAEGAKAAYRESFNERPNKVVLAKLVFHGIMTGGDMLAPQAIGGPFPSLAAYCKTFVARAKAGDNSDHWTCGRDAYVKDDPEPTRAKPTAPPFLQALLFTEETPEDGWTYRVAMQTKAGWFIGPRMWTRSANSDYGTVNRIAMGPAVAEGSSTLLVDWTFEYNERDREADISPFVRSEYLAICGADETGRVSCTPTIEYGYESGSDEHSESYSLDLDIAAAGLLTIGEKQGPLPKNMRDMLGKFTLEFR